VELAEVCAVSAVWDLLDRPLGVRLVSGSDTSESEEDESSGGSPSGGKDTLLGGPLVVAHHESVEAGVSVVTYSDFRSSG